MDHDDNERRSFAQYLNDHPKEAKQFFSTINRAFEQYRVAHSVLAGVAKQWDEMQARLAESLKAIRFPADLSTRLEEQLEALYPINWPRPVPDFDRMEEVLENDGIPIVHIPRAEIVQAIVDAEDYEARIAIIKARADDIAEDCRTALVEDYDEGLEMHVPLARRAVEAYQAGHFEAAQALAVSLCDTYLKKMFATGSKKRVGYQKMAEELALEKSGDASVSWAYNIGYALAPAVQFLVDWWPGDEGEPPTQLSRHVSIHNASIEHMTKLNATIAIMLVSGMSVALNYPMRLMLRPDS